MRSRISMVSSVELLRCVAMGHTASGPEGRIAEKGSAACVPIAGRHRFLPISQTPLEPAFPRILHSLRWSLPLRHPRHEHSDEESAFSFRF
jgi:hypothetical protein